MAKKDIRIILLLLIVAVLLIAVPLLTLKGAEFSGSDDAGSVMVEKIQGEYTPWFTPVLETLISGEIPGEIESLLFCLQTGIGIGVLAFLIGRMYERRKKH